MKANKSKKAPNSKGRYQFYSRFGFGSSGGQSSGKKRSVLDLRIIHRSLSKHKFKYEGLNLVPDMCGKGDYFVNFDLKSGYHHVDNHVDSWT